MRISDWSSDVCSSDLGGGIPIRPSVRAQWHRSRAADAAAERSRVSISRAAARDVSWLARIAGRFAARSFRQCPDRCLAGNRSEEHTSELQSLMRISYAVFCLKKKKI